VIAISALISAALFPVAPQQAQADLSLQQEYVCQPAGAFANGIGRVKFALDASNGFVGFSEPASWNVDVDAQLVLSGAPGKHLLWKSKDDRSFSGILLWEDDTALHPSRFGIVIKSDNKRIHWAKWSCKPSEPV